MLFNRWRQKVLPQGHIGATWRIRLNLCILRPTRVHNRNGKWIGLAVFEQLTAESGYTLQWAPLSTRIALPMEDLDLPSNTWCFQPTPLPSNRHHRSNGDCLECKGKIITSVLSNILCIWKDLTVLWIGFCLTGPISLCLDSFFMVALCNRETIYIFMLWFLSFFFPRLISAAGNWMFTILWHMMWP